MINRLWIVFIIVAKIFIFTIAKLLSANGTLPGNIGIFGIFIIIDYILVQACSSPAKDTMSITITRTYSSLIVPA